MAVLLFVIFWVLVAVTLLFIALSGGPSGARERLHTQSRRGRKGAFAAFGLALIALVGVIPALVIANVQSDDRTAIPESSVANLSEQEVRGREVFGRQCRICHALEAAGATARVGPNLDDLRPPENLVLDAIENGRARGNGAMPADIVEGADAEAVAAFVAKAVGQAGGEPGGGEGVEDDQNVGGGAGEGEAGDAEGGAVEEGGNDPQE